MSLQILTIHQVANLTGIEADGTYYPYTCSSTSHEHHTGFHDSVYRQAEMQGRLFTELVERGIYINQPEKYFFHGGHKTGYCL